MFTSTPAGFMPFFVAGAQRELKHEDQITTKWRNPARIESARKTVHSGRVWMFVMLVVHLGMVALAVRGWRGEFLGMSGSGWFALEWGAFIAGMGLGLWIFLAAPA